MSLPIIIMLSICTCLAILLTLSRVIGLRKIIQYSVVVDVAFTIGCFYLFAGTLGGTLVAVMSGLIMAMTLTAAKSYYVWAYEKGYILQPLKDPKPEPKENAKTVKSQAEAFAQSIPTTEEISDTVNGAIHGNVVRFSSLFKTKKAE